MEFQGQITKLLPIVEGVSKATDKAWAKKEIVVEESNPRNPEYPQALKIEMFKTEENIKWIKEEWTHKEGDEVILQDLSFKTNEYKGKYFTSISCFKIQKVEGLNSGGTQNNAVTPVQNNDVSDLPF